MTRTVTWPSSRPLTRAHPHEFGSTEFDGREDVDARFSPLYIGGRHAAVIYAGADDRTAAAETIFRSVSGHPGPRRVAADRYRSWQWSQVAATRDLALVAVDHTMDHAAQLVDGDATTYASSRAAAGDLLATYEDADGLLWCSCQLHDTPSQQDVDAAGDTLCVLLVARPGGGGVTRQELEAVGPSMPFWLPDGMARLDSIAVDLDITVVRS